MNVEFDRIPYDVVDRQFYGSMEELVNEVETIAVSRGFQEAVEQGCLYWRSRFSGCGSYVTVKSLLPPATLPFSE